MQYTQTHITQAQRAKRSRGCRRPRRTAASRSPAGALLCHDAGAAGLFHRGAAAPHHSSASFTKTAAGTVLHVWPGRPLAHRLPARPGQRAAAPTTPTSQPRRHRRQPAPRPAAHQRPAPHATGRLHERPSPQVHHLPRWGHHPLFQRRQRRRRLGMWLPQPSNAVVILAQRLDGA